MSAIGPTSPPPVDPARRVERVRRPGREDGADEQQRDGRQQDERPREERSEDDDGRVHIDLRV
jgi:hypothetical protein